MTSTLELFPPGVRPEQPPLPAEAATDVSLAENVEEPSPDSSVEPAPSQASEIDAQVAAQRQQLRERIGKSNSLSRGLRDRLTALLDGDIPAAKDDSQPLIPATDVLALLEEAIPPQLRLDANSLAQPEHPAGEAFFTGDPNQMTDDQAERIAREQLSRSAFGKKEGRG
jgi:hypothetical protein